MLICGTEYFLDAFKNLTHRQSLKSPDDKDYLQRESRSSRTDDRVHPKDVSNGESIYVPGGKDTLDLLLGVLGSWLASLDLHPLASELDVLHTMSVRT